MSQLTIGEIDMLDKQILQLMNCKPLTEGEVKTICDKVRICVCEIKKHLGKRNPVQGV
jgi:hypothetical protein